MSSGAPEREALKLDVKIDELKFDERGLIPAIVQDAHSRKVLTLANTKDSP